MPNKVFFAIALHFHQPVGNFDKILERAYNNCYRPFLEVFSKYPELKIALHFSGNLLDYFESTHPEFLDKVEGLVSKGNVEIIGGGYYEPIFQAIPSRDRIGQIKMLSDYSQEAFKARPAGIWIPERIWSPELTEDFVKSGIKYSILDDAHLIRAGISGEDTYGYFMTGPKGKEIAVFPSSKRLRYIIPFRPPRETIDYFKKISGTKKAPPLFTYGDDVEKFGEWPWTYDLVYKHGWLDKFFSLLRENRRWIELVFFSEYLRSHLPLGEVDIPESSYEEMSEWSGGSWMNFLSKYPESGHMHKRMLWLSNRINRLELSGEKALDRLKEARRLLYRSQCNCPYWHGVFGGIYLYHLRKAIYKNIIDADRICDGIEYNTPENLVNIKEADFYDRGKDSVVYENRDFFIIIDPLEGGIVRELDYKKASVNLINTLARQKEPYHRKVLGRINKEAVGPITIHEAIKSMDGRIRGGIFYDRYKRSCLVDHFIDAGLKRGDFMNCDYIDSGDFSSNPYAVTIGKNRVILSREGNVAGKKLMLSKEIRIISDSEIEILYVIKNKNGSGIDKLFGMEFNITMPDADSDRYTYEAGGKTLGRLDREGSLSGSSFFSIRDSGNGFSARFIFSEAPQDIWYFPVRTVSQSERSYDFNYQSSCIFPMWDIGPAGKEKRFSIRWVME